MHNDIFKACRISCKNDQLLEMIKSFNAIPDVLINSCTALIQGSTIKHNIHIDIISIG